MRINSLKKYFHAENIYPKKSLGQNFIIDIEIINQIIEIAGLSKDDEILEIGAGLGTLTVYLADKVKRVVAIEKDRRLSKELEKSLSEIKNLELYNEDILQVDLRRFYNENKMKVVSNLPYSISSPILIRLLEKRELYSLIVIMIQREVGERIVAKPGGRDYGSLSVLLQTYMEVTIGLRVPSDAFWPKPKVESVVIKLIPLNRPRIKITHEKLFNKVVRAAFSTRRKILGNALSSIFPKDKLNAILNSSGIDRTRRAETLSIEEFARIT
ncbi:MAG: 16S rRNA (adenine(1518)-N(6)/adenine(1519)-N(6))-dimethyltransferase RsmA, partial [Thermodesulfobacteriota bacterium]